ncbi:hypothetical protein HYDPIDRAFT_30347 [Hydnomerulius pinastri MD-312]|uniref:Uncharacterized protein n=1 Tax=Hydnomerulius pinastri MD-312 TaxID=994086 RepID=A0A0C9VW31_9AGAM|nr:hypothetical protein HYDPIDRAFT_30347 [Hydnomerulius pinastri MD-312]
MSVQLPDILSFCNVFNLRANKHCQCRAVSHASEKWLIDSGVLLPSGTEWSKAKVGLLVAACYPNTDATQLRLITDFLSLQLYRDEKAAASGECVGQGDSGYVRADIVSCAKGISPSQTPNLVTVLMRERNASLDSALVFAGTLIKQSADAFLEAEHEPLSSSDLGTDGEVQRYVLGLRDWIAGSVNWLYETQRFLGERESEVRTFGWVFVPVAQ